MRKIKIVVAILLALSLFAALAACGGNDQPAETGSTAPAPTGSTAPSTAPSAPPAPTGTGIQEGTSVGEGGLTVTGTAVAGTIDGTIGYGQVIEPLPGTEFEDEINLIIEVPVSMLDPQSPAGTASVNRLTYVLIYNRLTYFTEHQELVPELATSWEANADASVWTFKLRDDVTFHNGDKFTAQDVIDTWTSSKNEPGSLAWDNWLEVDSMRAINDYEVEMTLVRGYSAFAYNLSLPGAGIVNKKAREADPVRGLWVGTGPFKIDDFITGTSIHFSRNDNFWKEPAITQRMNWVFVPEVAARTVMLLNGEMDVCLSVAPRDNDMFLGANDFIVYSYAANSTHSLTFSMIHPITSDWNFRMAVAHAINREEAALVSSGRWAKPTRDGAFLGDSTPFRNTGLPMIPQDLDKAREYLAASVYNGETLEILTAPDTLTVSSQMLQEQMREIGINATVRTADVATLVSQSRFGDTNLSLLQFVGPFELNPTAARVMLYPEMSANRATYVNEEINELLDKVLTEPDPAEQQRIYFRVQEIVAEEIPQLSIFERIWTIVTHGNVGGIKVNPDMNHDLSYIFKMK